MQLMFPVGPDGSQRTLFLPEIPESNDVEYLAHKELVHLQREAQQKELQSLQVDQIQVIYDYSTNQETNAVKLKDLCFEILSREGG